MKLSTYQPNLSDPRVYQRCAHVVAWCKTHLYSKEPVEIYSKIIDKEFGPRSSKLSMWLRNKLLISSGGYVASYMSKDGNAKCLDYQLNQAGYDELRSLLSSITPDTISTKKKSRRKHLNDILHQFNDEDQYIILKKYEEFKDQIDNDTFIYHHSDNDGRDHHGLHKMKRIYKTKFWSTFGYIYDYDIEACAPTLLVQYAEQLGISPLLVSNIHEYISNKSKERARLAKLIDVDVNVIKDILNSLFNGAKLSAHYKCSLFRLIDYDYSKMYQLQSDQYVIDLRRHIKHAWNLIRRFEKINQMKEKKWSKGEKWGIYFKLERIVMNVIYDELQKNDVKYFNEHDGFRTKVMIPVNEIKDVVKMKTGFEIEIKLKEE